MIEYNNTTLHEEDHYDIIEELPKFYAKYDAFPVVLALLIVVTNGMNLLCMWRKGCCRRQSTNWFLGGLASCDLLTGLFGIPFYLACTSTYTLTICVTSVVFTHFVSILTTLHIVLITTDRYVSIVYSMRYPDLLTNKLTKTALTVSWLFAFMTASVQLTWIDYSTNVDKEGSAVEQKATKIFYILSFVLFFIIPLSWMVYCYTRIIYELLQQFKKIKKETIPRTINATRKYPCQYQRSRAIAVYIIIFATYILSWLPYHLFKLEELLKFTTHLQLAEVQYFFVYCRFLEPLLNPIVYTLGKKDLRKAVSSEVQNIARKFTCQGQDSERLPRAHIHALQIGNT